MAQGVLKLTFEARASLSSGCLLAAVHVSLLYKLTAVNPLVKLQTVSLVLHKQPKCSDQGVLPVCMFSVAVLSINGTKTFCRNIQSFSD